MCAQKLLHNSSLYVFVLLQVDISICLIATIIETMV